MDNGTEFASYPGPSEDGTHVVCLVDNGGFSAAGIAFDQGELAAFNEPRDGRSKRWFYVPDAKLIEVCPEVTRALKSYTAG